MEKFKRSFFFWTLAFLFIITAPLAVMRARGFRFDIQRGIFVHSGTIALKTNPSEVSVYIDQELQKSAKIDRINNSLNITGIIPGVYTISVQRDGFQSWSKKVQIRSGLAAEFWNVLLGKMEYKKTAYDTAGVKRFYVSPKDKYILYENENTEGVTATVFNPKSRVTKNNFSFPAWNLLEESRKENIEWSPEEERLSVPLQRVSAASAEKDPQKEPAVEYAYFVLSPEENNYFKLNEFLGKKNIRNIRWDPREKDYLFFLEETSLYRASITDKSDITLVSQNASSFELSESYVYHTELPNELVYKTDLRASAERVQITSTFPQDPVAPNNRLIVYDDSRIAFLDHNKNLFIYNRGMKDTYFKKLSSQAEGMQFSNDGKKFLYWTANEIYVYYLRDWETQPVKMENELLNITRYSDPIKNVQWFKDYEHVMFSAGSQLKIVELDHRDRRNYMEIIHTSVSDPFVVYNFTLERIFFTDHKNSQALDLYSVDFPEKTTLLGI